MIVRAGWRPASPSPDETAAGGSRDVRRFDAAAAHWRDVIVAAAIEAE